MILCQVSLNAQHISDFTSIPDQNENGTLKVPSTHNFQYLVYQGEYGTLDNFDFTAFVPIANSSSNGYLSLNHELVDGGVTVFDIQQNTSSKVWSLSNNKAVRYGEVNRPCSGAITSWGSVLSAEESTLGRILEVDPATGSSIWRYQLGRLAHENVVENLDNNRTFYTGEDTGSGVLLKFVADNPGDLSSGTLYTLDVNNAETAGTWIQIPNNSNTNTHQVALNAGATTFPGIEDVEISPIDGKVVFAVKGSGSIYRFIENDPLAGGTVSSFEKYVENTTYNTGNGNANFGTGVDNLAFDNLGNLWAFQDGGDHQMWVIDANHTPANPMVKLFGQTPVGAEPTGITFSPDHNYMFMSVQHPSSNPGSTQNDVFGNTITSNTLGLDYAVVIARNETWAASNANSVLDDFSSACAIETIPNGIEVSGTSYDPNLDRIYTISNGNNETDRYLNVLNRNGSSSPTNAGTIDLEGFLDPEGMTHISGNQFAISDENANAIYVFEITAATTTIVKSNTTEITINNLSLATNQSLEGITYSAIDDRMYFIEEGNDINNAANNPQLYYIPNFSTVSGSVSATTISFNLTDFAVCGSNFDFAGISILPDGTLLVVNQVCRELFSITLNGNSVADVDNLSLGHAQPEGVIVVSENEFWVVGEDDEIQLFVKPNVTSCDDGSACTTGETYDSNCGCTGGVIQDSDNDGVCDAEDCAPNDGSVYEGAICNDNDPCTTNDVLDDICNCVGTPSPDSDNDGVCDAEDCAPNDGSVYEGAICDDGDACTTGETYDSNCGCTGGVIQDSDNDGVCDAEDCAPNDGSVYEGAICDDGDPNTTSDIYNATCVCVGIPSSTCGYLDSDYESFESGLGIWNQVSVDDLDWTVNSGNTPSSNTGPSSASDGNNYIYLEASGSGGNPGKTGILVSDCFEIPTTGGAQITFDYHMYGTSSQMNLTLEVSIDDGASWISLWTNQGDQGNQWNEQVVGLSLYVNMPIILRFVGVTGETWSGDISLDAIDIEVNGCDEVGDACNDNDPCTTNDVLDDLCNCVGTPSPDSDNDGVCDIVDCEPNNATVYPGGPCDDGNVCTVGDTLYEADGVCDCIGNIIDSDNDGVCDAEDCAPNDGSVYLGAPCDDGNPNTPIDAIDINCNCTGIDYISDFGVLCYSINSSYNDSEELLFNGSTYEESTDIELIFDVNRGNQVVGLRFENVNIPDGATIVDASIQFTSDELNSVSTNLVIEGEAADNSAPITEGVNVISSRVRTSTAVAWAPPAWISVGANGTDQKTPDLGGIVQEIIDRPGYINGGAMTFIISGTGERTAVSFDKNPDQAPKLCIVYHLAQAFECNNFYYSTNFEAGLGAWSDGGIDCRRSINDSQYADSGDYCVRLRDNTNTSVLTSDIINGSNTDLINVSFSYIANSMEIGEDFWLQISTDGGATYTIAEDFVSGVDFVNNVREFETVSLYGPFSNNVRLRFRCDASSNGDYVYIDDIVVDLCNGFYFLQDPENLETELRSEITVDELTMKVYPNPVTMGDELIIEMPSDIEFEDLSIFSIDGKRAAQVKYNGTGKYRIPTSYISQGTYMIRLQTISEVIHKKIMVIN